MTLESRDRVWRAMQGSRVRSLTTWSQVYGAEPITQVRPCVARPRVAARRGGVGGRVWLRRRGPPPPTATTGPSETETPAASSFSPTAVPETPTSTPTALGNAPADSPTPTATEAGTSTPVRQSTPSPTSTVRPSPTREPTSTPDPTQADITTRSRSPRRCRAGSRVGPRHRQYVGPDGGHQRPAHRRQRGRELPA